MHAIIPDDLSIPIQKFKTHFNYSITLSLHETIHKIATSSILIRLNISNYTHDKSIHNHTNTHIKELQVPDFLFVNILSSFPPDLILLHYNLSIRSTTFLPINTILIFVFCISLTYYHGECIFKTLSEPISIILFK